MNSTVPSPIGGCPRSLRATKNCGGLHRKSLGQPPCGDSPVFAGNFLKLAPFYGVLRIPEEPLLFVLFIEGDAIFERRRIQPVDGLSADLGKGVHQVVDGLSLLWWVESQVTPFRHSDPVRI